MGNKVILITGISSGFGKQTARLLAGKGHSVYGTVRKETEHLAGVNYLTMDLTDSISIHQAVKTVIDKEGRIDVLVNNAGMHTGGPAENLPDDYLRLQLETNFTGMARITRAVLPGMRKQGGGMIINFSSIGGLMGLPFQAYYSAAKFATEGFSEALRMEVKKFNIKVVLINPGDFNTNNTSNRRGFLVPATENDPYDFARTLAVIEKEELHGSKPEVLAAKITEIVDLRNPRNRYIISSFEQKLAVFLHWLLPGKLFDKILMDFYKVK
jgi:NAD(P)-dependent dehydrogenase (short-subunit alcohol dehydrogenase family)